MAEERRQVGASCADKIWPAKLAQPPLDVVLSYLRQSPRHLCGNWQQQMGLQLVSL